MGLFSSNALFGEPGIYPDGPPMEPAPGAAPDGGAASAMAIDAAGTDSARVEGRLGSLAEADPPVGPPVVRAALALMAGTAAEPLLDEPIGSPADAKYRRRTTRAREGESYGP